MRNPPLPPCPESPQDCPEDQLTPDALQHGYRHNEAAAVGLTPQRELELTLTDQPPGFYSPASLAYWRKVGPQLGGWQAVLPSGEGCACGGGV